MKRLGTVLAATLLVLGTVGGPAAAQVPPHEHVLTVPGTGSDVDVGPPRCAIGSALQEAFLNFHFNVHLGTPNLTIEPRFC